MRAFLRGFHRFFNDLEADKEMDGKIKESEVPINLMKGVMHKDLKRWLMMSGQIIATSHDLTPNGGLVMEFPLFQGNLSWWNIIIWPDDV